MVFCVSTVLWCECRVVCKAVWFHVVSGPECPCPCVGSCSKWTGEGVRVGCGEAGASAPDLVI